jgi:uncharacterized protein
VYNNEKLNSFTNIMSLFYEITSPDGKKSYLLGTMHVNDEDIVNLPVEIKMAFDKASFFILEANKDVIDKDKLNAEFIAWKKNQVDLSSDAYYQYYLSAKAYFIKALQQNGIPSGLITEYMLYEMVGGQTPISLAGAMEIEKIFPNSARLQNVLDDQLKKQATAQNKSILYLEPSEEQLSAFNGFAFTFQEHIDYYNFVKKSLDEDHDISNLNELKQHFLNHDLEALKNTHLSSLKNKPEIFKKFNHKIIDERDAIMASRLKEYLTKGDAFTAVGAIHIPRIIKILAADGYKITPVPLSKQLAQVPNELENHLESPQSTSNFVRRTANLPCLRRLEIRHLIRELYDKTDNEVVKTIANTPSDVTLLDLAFNGLGIKSATILVKAFSGISGNINSLILSSNVFGYMDDLSIVLSGIPASVDYLDLGGNELYNKKGIELANNFISIPATVISLNLNKNYFNQMTVEELEKLKNALPHIRDVYLNDTEIEKMSPEQRHALVNVFPNIRHVYLVNSRGEELNCISHCGSGQLSLDFESIVPVPSLQYHAAFFIKNRTTINISEAPISNDLKYFINTF